MPNTSASGGYLQPIGPQPDEDAAFQRALQQVVAGIADLPGDLVRPRWQLKPPPVPPADTNWAAIGITNTRTEGTPVVVHDSSGEGSDRLIEHESVDLLVSFYGPNGAANAKRLRAGLHIPQNREALFLANMGLGSVGEVITAPALENQQWVRRFDLALTIRRRVERVYAVLNLKSVQGAVHTPEATSPFDTE